MDGKETLNLKKHKKIYKFSKNLFNKKNKKI